MKILIAAAVLMCTPVIAAFVVIGSFVAIIAGSTSNDSSSNAASSPGSSGANPNGNPNVPPGNGPLNVNAPYEAGGLTYADVINLEIAVGVPRNELATALAIAMAESGLRTNATNVNTDVYQSVDRGLWQINNHWHPDISDNQAYDPTGLGNARAMMEVSNNGTNWNPWSTYSSGAYLSHLGVAEEAVNEVIGP